MKHITTQRLVIITVFLLLGVLLVPTLVHAIISESISGTAHIINTDGLLDFDNNNSNAVVDLEAGAVSGYVWSEDIGWIDFSNNGDTNSVKVDLTDGSVTGRAYVINTNGHIDFTSYNSNVVWSSQTGTLTGYGWSEDLGWIDFSKTKLILTRTGEKILPFFSGAILFVGILVNQHRTSPFCPCPKTRR